MRWSRRRAVGAGALMFTAAIAAVLLTQRPGPAPSASVDGEPVPSDLVGRFFQSCQKDVDRGSESAANLTIRPDGGVVAQIISFEVATDAAGITTRTMAIHEEATAAVNSCLAERKAEVRREGRPPTPGERLLLADWVMRVEAPCLVARGVDAPLPEYSEFLDEESYPWYLLDSVSIDMDFDKLLEIRRACPPMPEFLRSDGVGW